MLQVYTAEHPTEAHYVKGLLESQGISCDVRGEFLFGARGALPITTETAPSIWIFDDAKYNDAIELIKEYENLKNKDTSNDPSWVAGYATHVVKSLKRSLPHAGIVSNLEPLKNKR